MESRSHPQPRSSAFGLVFAVALPILRDVAKDHGYCLAVHGSMHRDLDLLACPWVACASTPDALVEAIRQAVNGRYCPRDWDPNPSHRPHGRLAYAVYLDDESWQEQNGPYLDISVMPPLISASDEAI